MRRIGLYLLLVISIGCTKKQAKLNLTINLIDSNRSVKISGFDKAVIADIARDTANNIGQSLLPVYKMPADTDMKDYQQEQPGKYKFADTSVVFTPDTPFKRKQAYFLRYYPHNESEDAWQYIRDKKRPGTLGHKDLVFSY
ncbi:hypothetical protein ACPPVU_25660 [Mucilaginibacter sp. McL0603]|uniref:hypothetical protein n=1 Tax=Mucilaginibacter sp. McL0603 TaxID=3415670 RepID=UPI003CF7A35C